MAPLITPPSERPNPRWHLLNLVPLWILQALTSTIISFLPFICFMSCGPTNKPIHYMALGMCAISYITILSESYLFAFRSLTPLRSLGLQATKTMVVGCQWMVVWVYDARGTGQAKQWVLMVLMSGLFAMLSLPMSVHFGYAAVHYLWKGLGRRRSGKYGELGSKAETEGLVGGGEEDDTQLRKDEIPVARSLDEDLQWPPRGKFLGNWIMQLSFAPLLCLLRFLGPSSPLGKLSAFGGWVTSSITALLLGFVCYGIWYSFRKDGERLSLRRYLHLQIVKVGLAYFLFDMIVLAHGGWQLHVGNWARSLVAVFALSVLFGTPYITECMLAISEYEKCR